MASERCAGSWLAKAQLHPVARVKGVPFGVGMGAIARSFGVVSLWLKISRCPCDCHRDMGYPEKLPIPAHRLNTGSASMASLPARLALLVKFEHLRQCGFIQRGSSLGVLQVSIICHVHAQGKECLWIGCRVEQYFPQMRAKPPDQAVGFPAWMDGMPTPAHPRQMGSHKCWIAIVPVAWHTRTSSGHP